MKGFQNIIFYDLFFIWIRFPFMIFYGFKLWLCVLMVLDLFFYDLFMGTLVALTFLLQNQLLWWEKASGKGKL